MSILQEKKNPEVYSQLVNGAFSVQIGDKNHFGRIPVNQNVDETANKDTNCRRYNDF